MTQPIPSFAVSIGGLALITILLVSLYYVRKQAILEALEMRGIGSGSSSSRPKPPVKPQRQQRQEGDGVVFHDRELFNRVHGGAEGGGGDWEGDKAYVEKGGDSKGKGRMKDHHSIEITGQDVEVEGLDFEFARGRS
jgi:hypothetical protein